MRLVALTALVSIGAALAGCRPARPAEASAVAPELVLEGVDFRIDRAGTPRAQGSAEVVTFRRDTTAVAARDLTLRLGGQAGAGGEVTLRAPGAAGVAAEHRFDASGGLVAQRGGDRAETPTARYEPGGPGGAGLVRGDEPVVATGPGYRLTGDRFTLDPATGVIALTGHARLVSGLRGGR